MLLSNVSTAGAPRCVELFSPREYARPEYNLTLSKDLSQRKSKAKFVENSLEAALNIVGDRLEVPDFKVTLEGFSENGNSADLFANRLHLDDTATAGVIAHELGHLVFIQAVRTHAPEAYDLIKAGRAANEPRVLDQMSAAQATSSLVNAYAEQFCDLLAILTTKHSSLFAGSPIARIESSRDWQNDVELPWENRRKPQVNFPRQKRFEYSRMSEFRRLLWTEYRESLFGSKKDRRLILYAVARSMTEEIARSWKLDLTDQERNQALIGRLRIELENSFTP